MHKAIIFLHVLHSDINVIFLCKYKTEVTNHQPGVELGKELFIILTVISRIKLLYH